MNDLVDSTAFIIHNRSDDPWVTSVAVLKAVAVTIRAEGIEKEDAALLSSAMWIETQLDKFAFSALELKCISSLVTPKSDPQKAAKTILKT